MKISFSELTKYQLILVNVFAETAMGTSLLEMGEFQQKYREAVHDMSKIIVYR